MKIAYNIILLIIWSYGFSFSSYCLFQYISNKKYDDAFMFCFAMAYYIAIIPLVLSINLLDIMTNKK